MPRPVAVAALVVVTLPAAIAHAERLSVEVGAGAGAYTDGDGDAQVGLAVSLGVGLATRRHLAFDLRYVRVQQLASSPSPTRHQALDLSALFFPREPVFVAVGLGFAGANSPGPAASVRLGAVLTTTAGGYWFGAIEGLASAAIDGDSDSSRAAVLAVGYRAR